jgi:hypothetical protein
MHDRFLSIGVIHNKMIDISVKFAFTGPENLLLTVPAVFIIQSIVRTDRHKPHNTASMVAFDENFRHADEITGNSEHSGALIVLTNPQRDVGPLKLID